MTIPRDKTLEVDPGPLKCNGCRQGYHDERSRVCSWCDATDRFPAKYLRRRNIGGKRGRNSGTVGTAKSKS